MCLPFSSPHAALWHGRLRTTCTSFFFRDLELITQCNLGPEGPGDRREPLLIPLLLPLGVQGAALGT